MPGAQVTSMPKLASKKLAALLEAAESQLRVKVHRALMRRAILHELSMCYLPTYATSIELLPTVVAGSRACRSKSDNF